MSHQWPKVKSWFNIIDSTSVSTPIPIHRIPHIPFINHDIRVLRRSQNKARSRVDGKGRKKGFAEKQLWGSTKSVVGQSRSYVLLMKKEMKRWKSNMTRCLENKQSRNNRVHAVNPCSASLHCEASDVLGAPVETW
jgi:hypothetical protein